MFTDKASGKDTDRPKLDEMLAFVRDGPRVGPWRTPVDRLLAAGLGRGGRFISDSS